MEFKACCIVLLFGEFMAWPAMMWFIPFPLDVEFFIWCWAINGFFCCWAMPALCWYWFRLLTDWAEAFWRALVHAAAAAWAVVGCCGFDCCCCCHCWFQLTPFEHEVNDGEVEGEIECVELLVNLFWELSIKDKFINQISNLFKL